MRRPLISLDIFSDHSSVLADCGKNGKNVKISDNAKEILHRVIAEDLTPLQRKTVTAYYFENKSTVQIASENGVNKASVSRTLKRARERISMAMKYGIFNMWEEK